MDKFSANQNIIHAYIKYLYVYTHKTYYKYVSFIYIYIYIHICANTFASEVLNFPLGSTSLSCLS